MYYAKRPSPLTCAAAGGIFTAGLASLIARAIHTFTTFKLAHPFDWVLYVTATVGVIGGGAFITWLIARTLRHQIAALRAENQTLRAERDKLDTVLQAVKDADQQGEINGVRLNKALDLLNELKGRQIADADTGPIPRLHSINGRGGGLDLVPPPAPHQGTAPA